MRFSGGWLCASLFVAGCNATYAPPIRAVQYGAPARLEQGHVEVGGDAGGFSAPTAGGPHVGVGIRDWVALEAGGNFQLVMGNVHKWAMGFVGPRFSYAPHRQEAVHFVGDLELGLGAGVGGVLDDNDAPSKDCTSCDGRAATDRIAGGGYAGIGIGEQIHWFSVFARVRVEGSTATNVPTTVWPSATAGVEFNIRKRAAITLAGGYIGYTNARDTEHGWFYQLGVTAFFDARDRAAAPTTAPTPPRPPTPPPPPPPLQEDWDEPAPDVDAPTDDEE